MSAGGRAGSGSLSSTLSSSGKCGHSPRNAFRHHVEKPVHITTLSVIGLSGTDSVKGNAGVGKSTLCNRLVRPHYVDFYGEHITYLSQADFSCSRVINGEHWLYWGEAELDASDYPGRTTHVRVIEQTVFLDDESFETLGGASKAADYTKRALKTNVESPGKLMYICRDQLGQESDFVCHPLSDGRSSVDGFVVVFDVSHVEGRCSFTKQADYALGLITGALKAKKPVFIVATKCDRMIPDGITSYQKLLARKELKSHLGTLLFPAEVSAYENINVAEILYLAAYVIDKTKNKPKLLPFTEMQRMRNEKLSLVRTDFLELLRSLLPREEYPLRQSTQVAWPILLSDFGVATNPVYEAFVAEFGPQAAQNCYREHQRASREWWMEHELSARLPSLRDVLRKMFERSELCNAKWEGLVEEIQAHAQFDNFFRPFGRSLDRFNNAMWDERLPSEILEKPEARHLFQDLQKELIEEIALERQAERFRTLLSQKEAVTPGKSFEDARVIIEEVAAFEQALPPDSARRIYEGFQQELKRRAGKDFTELLLEKVALFVDLVVAWRLEHADVPMIGLDERENSMLSAQLCDDKRYRNMNAMSAERQEAISRFASFFALPLVRHCPSADLCADMLTPNALDTKTCARKFWSVSLVVYGTDRVVDEFFSAVKLVTNRDGLFGYNGGTVSVCCFRAGEGSASTRVRTPVYLLDSLESTELVFAAQQKEAPRLPPVFVHVGDPARFDLLPSLHQMAYQLAEKFGGTFIAAGSPSGSRSSRMSASDLSPYFRADQVQRVLGEVCAGQLDSGYADLRIRISFVCGDSFRMESVLKPLMDQCHQVDVAGHSLEMDTTLPSEQVNVRVRADICSYHNWMMSKWTLNTFQGHVLVYTPTRRASLGHVETAVRLLLDAASNCAGGSADRRAMARAILIVAVDDPSNYFTNKEASQLLNDGARLAEDVGCSFASVSPNRSHASEFQVFVDFFEKIYNNDALPAEYYTITQRAASVFHSPSTKTSRTLTTYRGSTLTGSASTLLSNGSSNDGSSSSASRSHHSPQIASRASMSPLATRSTTSAAIFSDRDRSKGVLRNLSKTGRQNRGKIRPSSTNFESSSSPFRSAKSGVNVGGDFVYQVYEGEESETHTDCHLKDSSAQENSCTAEATVHSPNVTRLRIRDDISLSSDSAASCPTNSLHEEPSSSKLPREAGVRFRVNGVEQSPVRCGVILSDRRLLSRSMDSLIQPTVIELKDEDVPIDVMVQSVICESETFRPGQRQASLRDRRRNRSARRWINENSSNLARRVTAGWKRNKKTTTNSVPQSPSVEFNPLVKSSSAVSSAFAWLPTRSPKRRVKSDIDSIASPPNAASSTNLCLITLSNTPDRLPLFVTKCVEYMEEEGGLHMEGIYRTSGSQNLAAELDRFMTRPEELDLKSKDYPMPVVWMSVKNFFGSLREALIPKPVHNEILESIAGLCGPANSRLSTPVDEKLVGVQRILRDRVPELNRHVLRYLMAHLKRVAGYSAQNGMDARNLAKVWCPTVFQPAFESFEELSGQLCVFETATFLMLTHSDILFSPVDSA